MLSSKSIWICHSPVWHSSWYRNITLSETPFWNSKAEEEWGRVEQQDFPFFFTRLVSFWAFSLREIFDWALEALLRHIFLWEWSIHTTWRRTPPTSRVGFFSLKKKPSNYKWKLLGGGHELVHAACHCMAHLLCETHLTQVSQNNQHDIIIPASSTSIVLLPFMTLLAP